MKLNKKTIFNWLFIIIMLSTLLFAISLLIVEFVFNWNHPNYTRMMVFQKFWKWDASLLIGGFLLIILQYLGGDE
jgi:uncharacterized membrane protein